MMIENYLQRIQEGRFFSDKTISIDLDKFINGESNKLIIAGLSGGGKTTLCRYLAGKYNAKCYETDDCSHSLTKEEIELFRTDEEFRKEKLDTPEITPVKKIFKKAYEKCIRPQVLSNKRYILEGGLLWGAALLFSEIRKEIEKYPVIIMGTSSLQASIRAITRSKKWNDPYKIYRTYVKNFILLNRLLKEYTEQRIKAGGDIKEFVIPKDIIGDTK